MSTENKYKYSNPKKSKIDNKNMDKIHYGYDNKLGVIHIADKI